MHSLAVNGTPWSAPIGPPPSSRLLRRARLLERLLVARQHDDVQVLALLGAVDVGLDQLHRADLAAAHRARHPGR